MIKLYFFIGESVTSSTRVEGLFCRLSELLLVSIVCIVA